MDKKRKKNIVFTFLRQQLYALFKIQNTEKLPESTISAIAANFSKSSSELSLEEAILNLNNKPLGLPVEVDFSS